MVDDVPFDNGPAPGPEAATHVRETLKLIYKIAMIATTVVLATLAYLAYRSSVPGTGDVLLSLVLAVLALFALLSIPKLDWQDEQADVYRDIFDDARARFDVRGRFRSTGLSSPGPAAGDPEISVSFADPEVHRVDADTVTRAKQMASEGASIDDICRMIDPSHDSNDRFHQQAFRRIVQAMLDEG